jgi:hypothetical protein
MLGMRGEDSEEDEVVKLAEEAGTLVSGMLSVSGFVEAITALVTGKDQYLKQRALQLLSSRMQAIGDAVPSHEQSEMLLTLLPPLKYARHSLIPNLILIILIILLLIIFIIIIIIIFIPILMTVHEKAPCLSRLRTSADSRILSTG